MMKPVVTFSAVVLAGAMTGAQSQSQAPVFRSGVSLVTIDVTVVDKDGKPVDDLKPSDFVAKIDGKERPVQTLDFLRFGDTKIGDTPQVGSTGSAPMLPSRGAQTFMLVFDDLSFTPGAGKGMPIAGERLLERLDAGALVGVIATSGQGPNVSPTRNRADVAAALKTLVGQNVDNALPFFIGTHEAIDIERGFIRDALDRVAARECPLVDVGENCPDLIKTRARVLAVASRRRVEQQLSSINQIVEAMSRAPAPRVVIVMTAGVALQSELNMRDPLGALSDVAAASGVQLYALVADGQVIDMGDTGGLRASARREQQRTLSEGMMSVASATGGSAFHVIGDAGRFFDRVVSETSAIYRLGIEVPDVTDVTDVTDVSVGDGPRRVEVSVGRKGVTVRSTGRALAEVTAAPLSRDEAMKLRLAQGGSASGVPVRVAAKLRKNNAPGIQVMVDARLPSTVATPIHLLFGLMDDKGTMVFAGSRDLLAAPASGEHQMLFPIAVPEGSYRLRFVAGDSADHIGSVEVPVAAALTRLGEFEVSDLMTVYPTANGQDAFSGFDDAPPSAEEVIATLEIYQTATATPGPSTSVRFSIARVDDEASVVERTTTPVSSFDRWTASAALPLNALESGRYVIRATLLQGDVVAGTQTRTLNKR